METKNMYGKLLQGESPKLALIMIIPIIIIVFVIIPWLLVKPAYFSSFDFSQSGAIGDTIGGITNPLIALLAAVLTFLAFWVQFQANRRYETQFKEQNESTRLDRFQSRYLEQINLHRSNIVEFNIEDKLYGRKCFQTMFYEFKFCYYAIKKSYTNDVNNGNTNKSLDEFDFTNIAYVTFFTGIGTNSETMSMELLKNYDKHILYNYFNLLKSFQNTANYVIIEKDENSNFKLKVRYRLFEGHMSRLGHYFRHLFQLVKYIDKQDDAVVKDKYEYAKTLRAQLSNFEQLLLHYNSMSVMGSSWHEEGYIKDYRLIKNIPLAYADFGITPEKYYGKLNETNFHNFEWNEIMESIDNADRTQ